ncbi:MAG: hypothetical protein ACUVTH_06265, partial [Thermogutta sp.]
MPENASQEPKRSQVERLKEASASLFHPLANEVDNDQPSFSEAAAQILKHHGSYQQDDRDTRKAQRGTSRLRCGTWKRPRRSPRP